MKGLDLMSSIDLTEPISTPPQQAWIPSPLYRVSLEKYKAMIVSGAFTKRDRVHLINGYLVERMTELPPHGAACEATRTAVEPMLPDGWHIRSDRPLKMPGQASMPEPDQTVVRGTWRDYARRYPEPRDTALVVAVSSTSLYEDRAMAGIYAAGGVPIYWIVNLVDRQVEVYTVPGVAGYQSRADFKPGQTIPVVIDGQQVGQIAVDDLLP
jgi:Uma2 family endonuclease